MKRLKCNFEEESEIYKIIETFNIELKKVRVNIKKKTMTIILKSEEIIRKDNMDQLLSFFISRFKDFTIKVSVDYEIDGLSDDEKLEFLKPRILEIIEEDINSSVSWISRLELKYKNGNLFIYPPNETSLYMLEKNGLRYRLIEELSLKGNVLISDESYKSKLEDKDDFLINKQEEEKRMAKEVATMPRQKPKSEEGLKASKNYRLGKTISSESIPIEDVSLQSGNVTVKGYVFNVEAKEIRNNKKIITFNITDFTDSMTVKIFLANDKADEFLINVKEDKSVMINGDMTFDNFARTTVMMLKSLSMIEIEGRMDRSEEKRVELHLHTKMSSMDGIVSVKDLIKTAEKWGHKAVAITDHGVVQAFPEAMALESKSDVKVIYGMEGYMVNDKKEIVTNLKEGKVYDSYVVFDIETTGLSNINDKITEIGAIKIRDGKIVDEFSQLINPEREIPDFIVNLTGITDEMVKGQPTIEEVVPEFKKFIEDSILVAHNAVFDIGFIRENFNRSGINELTNPVLDTLELARAVFPNLKNHKLNTIAKHLQVKLDNHHRAVDDAKATADILLKILELAGSVKMEGAHRINELNKDNDGLKDRPFHIVFLATNLVGLKNLYKLVSASHLQYFHRNPRLPKSLIERYREGLLISSACSSGELYQAILNNKSEDEIKDIVKFYDYLEIQPLGNNSYLVDDGILTVEQLKEINKKIYRLGKEHNKPVVATGDVHFLNPEDSIYRKILMAGQNFRDYDKQPPIYFKTTEEMLEDFDYLGEDIAREVVIENTNYINDLVEDIKPIPDGTFPPVIEGSEEELRQITYEKAYELYGNPLPEIVEKRLERELTSIIKNGYAVMYIIAQKLVWKSLEDGYLVGSRGSVGSSFAATMSGITEINPLAPHYLCPSCKFSEFFEGGEIASGADLPDKDCPKCGEELIKDGHDIPFEVFLGFEGDKEPDIDLNFAGEYQPRAHKYTEDLFGEGYVFRAGTIGTIAERTAYGFVKKYFEGEDQIVNPAEINRLVKGCTGIKRTSGQHPGGVMIVPHYKDIMDFSPIQYPANDGSSGVITTHFDYNAISSNILKLDILGHDVPTIIRMLEDMTGVISTDIPLDEKKTMSLFSSTEALGVTKEEIDCPVGTLGIPEFGTKFVRQMLVDTNPSTFSELVRISGLSHGTDVWMNNAQDLVRQGIAPLSKVISTREDIMLGLINVGMDKSKAFNIMEKVRKGKGLPPGAEEEMIALGVEDWYIDSCKKIKYMFPKAHAAAYVMMSFRIAYYKVYYPEAFYATYFTTKAADFDADLMVQGKEFIRLKINELESLGYDITTKEKNLLTVLEVALEMYARGYKVEKVDLYKSDSDKFKVVDGGILPPLKCLDGLGENAARKVAEEREKGEFISIEDLVKRTGVSRPAVDILISHGCMAEIPESNQISLFNI